MINFIRQRYGLNATNGVFKLWFNDGVFFLLHERIINVVDSDIKMDFIIL